MPKTFTYKVKKVIDGDTFLIENGLTVRLAGVDTPEKGKPGSAKARAYLRNQIEGKKVLIRPVAKDCYRRVVAYVYKDGKSLCKKIRNKKWTSSRRKH